MCRLHSQGHRLQIQELWAGETVSHSFARGETLAEALTYHFRVELGMRDHRKVFPGRVVPHQVDVRELFFQQWFREHLGIEWQLPAHGVRHTVAMPGGIQRALELPCHDEDSLSELARAYRGQGYEVPGIPEHLRFGSFSHRRGVVCISLETENEKTPTQIDEVELKLFVGPWRAVVELAVFLADQGWDFRRPNQLQAFVTFPSRLVRSRRQHQGQDDPVKVEVWYPALLPPQEAFGVAEGFVPAPLGDLEPYRSGGSEELLDALRRAVDVAFPVDGGQRAFALANPRAPRITLRRSSDPFELTVPVLLVLPPSGLAEIVAILHDTTGDHVRLCHELKVDGTSILIAPNLPHQTHCNDPEGFVRVLPDALRQIEGLGAAWLIEDFVLGGEHEGRELSAEGSAAARYPGW